MKKYLFLAAAIVISLSVAGCSGGKNAAKENPARSTAASDTTAEHDSGSKTDSAESKPDGAGSSSDDSSSDESGSGSEQGESKYDENFTGADEDVDMDAIDGVDASVADDSAAKGDVNGSEITIGDAKVTDFNGQKVIIITYKFKNTSEQDAAFVSRINTEANQGEAYLAPATAFTAEGYVPETLVQNVPYGETITVQRAFTLVNEETPVTIMAESAVNPTLEERVTKTFEIK